jgi:SprT protein
MKADHRALDAASLGPRPFKAARAESVAETVAESLGPLAPHLPAVAWPHVAALLDQHPLEVRLSRPRRTKLGDHRPPGRDVAVHRITVNTDLNPWAFLTTLLHEVAHAAAWERSRGRRLPPHGPHWQETFSGLLAPLLGDGVFPADVADALGRSLARPRAATCSDRQLLLALRRHDPHDGRRVLVETLPEGAVFRIDRGTVFRAGRPLRSRRQCFECRTGREYRVHGLLLVETLSDCEAAGSPPCGRSSRSSPPRGRRRR